MAPALDMGLVAVEKPWLAAIVAEAAGEIQRRQVADILEQPVAVDILELVVAAVDSPVAGNPELVVVADRLGVNMMMTVVAAEAVAAGMRQAPVSRDWLSGQADNSRQCHHLGQKVVVLMIWS